MLTKEERQKLVVDAGHCDSHHGMCACHAHMVAIRIDNAHKLLEEFAKTLDLDRRKAAEVQKVLNGLELALRDVCATTRGVLV